MKAELTEYAFTQAAQPPMQQTKPLSSRIFLLSVRTAFTGPGWLSLLLCPIIQLPVLLCPFPHKVRLHVEFFSHIPVPTILKARFLLQFITGQWMQVPKSLQLCAQSCLKSLLFW